MILWRPLSHRRPENVMRELVVGLQTKADVCGALIVSFELSDLQYDSSIAAGSEC